MIRRAEIRRSGREQFLFYFVRIRAFLPRFVLDFVDPVGPFVGDTLRFPALRSLRFVPSVIRNRDVRRSRRDRAPATL